MLIILIYSGIRAFRRPLLVLGLNASDSVRSQLLLVRSLAASQTLIAILAITNYHVQIINRLSSGYPVWYWWVARCLVGNKDQSLGLVVAVFITMYAGIQGGLFASFLPPA